jgi:hypothetical protein
MSYVSRALDIATRLRAGLSIQSCHIATLKLPHQPRRLASLALAPFPEPADCFVDGSCSNDKEDLQDWRFGLAVLKVLDWRYAGSRGLLVGRFAGQGNKFRHQQKPSSGGHPCLI